MIPPILHPQLVLMRLLVFASGIVDDFNSLGVSR
jgi:hypothetical protein